MKVKLEPKFTLHSSLSFAGALLLMKKNYIAGNWTEGVDYINNINPSDLSDVIGQFAQADINQTNMAIDSASAALKDWSDSPLQFRSDILDKVGNNILSRSQELGMLLAREEGKTAAEGIGEVIRAGHIFKFFGAEVLRQKGDFFNSRRFTEITFLCNIYK